MIKLHRIWTPEQAGVYPLGLEELETLLNEGWKIIKETVVYKSIIYVLQKKEKK
mgnify:CR=1 FL=1